MEGAYAGLGQQTTQSGSNLFSCRHTPQVMGWLATAVMAAAAVAMFATW